MPGRNNQERKGRKGPSPRVAQRQMPIIQQSDTDTDSENRKNTLQSSNLERNESNSSADYVVEKVARNDSLKETYGEWG